MDTVVNNTDTTYIELDVAENELVRLLQSKAVMENATGFTTRELTKITGLSRDRIRERLTELANTGQLIIAQRSTRRLDGKICYVPVYSVKS